MLSCVISSELNFQLVGSEVPHGSSLPDAAYCPVCFELITEPVVYPCAHEVCKPCFEQCVATGNLHCPVCRHRISSWARRCKKKGCVVDEARRSKIAADLEEALGSGDAARCAMHSISVYTQINFMYICG